MNRYIIKMMKGAMPFVALALSTACTDFLDKNPGNLVVPTTVNEYSSLLMEGYPTTDVFIRTEWLTDNMDYAANSDANKLAQAFYFFKDNHIDPSVVADGRDFFWDELYKAAYYANITMSELLALAEEEKSTAEYNQVLGEAYALRAYAHLMLVNLYGLPYNVGDPASNLGVPLSDTPNAADHVGNNTRATVKEVYDFVMQDITQARELLELGTNENLELKHRFSTSALDAMSARIALYQENWDQVIELATSLVSKYPIVDSSTFQSYGNLFSKGGLNNEVLFRTGANYFTDLYDFLRGQNSIRMSAYLYSLYPDGDSRKSPIYFDSRDNSYSPVNKLDLYTPSPVFRSSELLLSRAEAYAQKGDLDKAVADLNLLRSKRILGYTPVATSDIGGQAEILAAVLNERRLELLYEGHRWFDLRRTGMPEIVHEFKDQTYILKQGDPRYVLQIPQQELEVSPDMQINPRD
ncbi:RagB/SusD family nutrient uptake outer membrane protein [Limibacter armeniacum]|uniref:RagB/SusD family nutrient uptake outer membrane protein n=1 Tax=Limibacter armeniacum TaxID=466084 RepID=UPI002FE5819D